MRVFRLDGRTFACHRDRGRRWPLGDETGFGGESPFAIDRLRIRGRYVAYQLAFFDRNDVDYRVRVLSATSGRLRVDDDPIAAEPVAETRADDETGVQSLVLEANGSVAWIAGDPGTGGVRRYEVARHDRDGYRLLASGADIAPRSLRLLDDRVIRWMDAGTARRARLR